MTGGLVWLCGVCPAQSHVAHINWLVTISAKIVLAIRDSVIIERLQWRERSSSKFFLLLASFRNNIFGAGTNTSFLKIRTIIIFVTLMPYVLMHQTVPVIMLVGTRAERHPYYSSCKNVLKLEMKTIPTRQLWNRANLSADSVWSECKSSRMITKVMHRYSIICLCCAAKEGLLK